jgi:hypothetical protein
MSELGAKRQQLEVARQTLSTLEMQAAGYTALTMPAHLQTELEGKRKEVAELEEEVKRLRKSKPSAKTPPQSFHIPFQNREDEIKDILSSFAPPYFLLDAPAGYGKSVLLQRLAKRFNEKGWLAAYVRLEEGKRLSQLITKLSKELGVRCSPRGSDVYRWGAALAGVTKNEKLEEITQNGLVFLIDLDKKPVAGVLEDLLDQFIPAVQGSLRVLPFFLGEHNRFRVILAGRCLAEQAKVASHAIPLSVRRLTPFNYGVVRETVRTLFPHHTDAAVTQIAAHTMYLTGGHPGCIAHCLKKYEEAGLTPDDFLDFCSDEVWKEIVRSVVQDVRDHVPQDLCHVLDRLSVFRYLDYPSLNRLTGGDEPIVVGYGNGYDLADRLTGTYLLSWHGRLLRDDITRRLLAIRLREEEKNFPQWCWQAQGMCKDCLQRPDTQSPEAWALEYLYQVLQEDAGVVCDSNQRAAMRARFFTDEVPQALQWLAGGRQPIAEKRALEQALDADWEFRFTVNYFLREEPYSDLPYQQLRGRIEES